MSFTRCSTRAFASARPLRRIDSVRIAADIPPAGSEPRVESPWRRFAAEFAESRMALAGLFHRCRAIERGPHRIPFVFQGVLNKLNYFILIINH